MAKTYPRWRRTRHHYTHPDPRCHPPCAAIGCDKPATRFEEYEVDYMRGNDEHAKLCEEHAERLRNGDFTLLGYI